MITIFGTLYSSKNSKRIIFRKGMKHPKVIKSKKSLESEPQLLLQLKSNIRKWNAMVMMSMKQKSVVYPLRVQFKIYRKTKARFDFCNIIQQISDQMVFAKYMPDDSADYFIPVFEPYEVDTKNPRTEIIIL